MLPLQTLSDPAWAVMVLSIATIFAVLFGFIWAFGKISEEPDRDSGRRGRGV